MKNLVIGFLSLSLLTVSVFCKEKKSAPADKSAREISYQRLFLITRSLNENQVIYEAALDEAGFSIKDPVNIYWTIYGKKGTTKETLNAIEKKIGYGIEITTTTREEVGFYVKSLPENPIKAVITRSEDETAARALMYINGEESVVSQIYIESKSAFPLPKVIYIDITGVSLKTGKEITERIIPKK
ncbi:MAG: DUF4833 domain-containing protein [Elusimicrobiota bacterium]|nr:DUF4833 domain-containing protein [Elusimicrobiota bacterium]